jgi:prolyl oligopeptidase
MVMSMTAAPAAAAAEAAAVGAGSSAYVDGVLWAEALLLAVLVIWWLEEFGIVQVGLYKFILSLHGGNKTTGGGSSEGNDNGSVPVLFTSYGYPLEIDTAKEGSDAITWNGSKQFSGIHMYFRFLHQLHTARTIRWIKHQRNCVVGYFSSYSELRNIVLNKFSEASNYAQIIQPVKVGQSFFFYRKNESLKAGCFIYAKASSLEETGTVVLDLNGPLFDVSSPENEHASAFVDAWPSEDAVYVAFGLSYRDIKGPAMRIMIKNTVTDEMLPDNLTSGDVIGNVVWDLRCQGFFYSFRGEPSCVRYHKLGTTQDADSLIFSRLYQDIRVYNTLRLSSNGLTLIVHVFKRSDLSELKTCYSESAGNSLIIIDVGKFVTDHVSAASSASGITELVSGFDHRYEYITSNNQFMWLRTNKDAPLFRIIKLCLLQAEFEAVDIYRRVKNFDGLCKDCVSEDSEGAFLESAQAADRNILVVKYMLHASHSVMLYRIPFESYDSNGVNSGNDGRFEAVPVAELPHSDHGQISGPFCSPISPEIVYKYTGFTDAGSIFCAKLTRSTVSSAGTEINRQSEVSQIGINLDPPTTIPIPGLDCSQFETRQEFVVGPYGTSIPVYLVGSQAMFEERSVSHWDARPCLLCAYGGFGVPIVPHFSLFMLLFMKQCGGMICVANVPGGGEYGPQHHRSGSGRHRINAVDDFIKVAEYLIENEYTTQQQLGLLSGGIGGLLIGAAINKRPWLFSAAIVTDGFFDSHNYSQFSPVVDHEITVGHVMKQPPCCATSAAAAATLSANLLTSAGVSSPISPSATPPTSSQYVRETGSTESSPENANEIVSPVHTVANRDIPYPAVMLVVSNPKLIGNFASVVCAG